IGSISPFNGTASYPIANAVFENCLINPNLGSGPAIQISNTNPAKGYQVLGTPFENLTLERCYLGGHSKYNIVGSGMGNGLRIVDLMTGYHKENILDDPPGMTNS